MLKDMFKKARYISIPMVRREREIYGVVESEKTEKRCKGCERVLPPPREPDFKVCPHCGRHERLTAMERIELTADEGSFSELFDGVAPCNPLGFPGYTEKMDSLQEKTGLTDAVVTGICEIMGNKTLLAVMDSRFMMASMGSAVGEKLALLFEKGAKEGLPVVVFAASGGARMQEGILSLMQMAKVSGAVGVHSDAGGLYIVALTDPTTGGVTASFAMLGDVILAEPHALIGFAGKRVIEGTIREKLPDTFQRAEFQREHGFVDAIVPRAEMRSALGRLLAWHKRGGGVGSGA